MPPYYNHFLTRDYLHVVLVALMTSQIYSVLLLPIENTKSKTTFPMRANNRHLLEKAITLKHQRFSTIATFADFTLYGELFDG